jgi:hypothetical protein
MPVSAAGGYAMRRLVVTAGLSLLTLTLIGGCGSSAKKTATATASPAVSPTPTPAAVLHRLEFKRYLHDLKPLIGAEPALYKRMLAADKRVADGGMSRDQAIATMSPFLDAYTSLHAKVARLRPPRKARAAHRHLRTYLDLVRRSMALEIEGIRYATSSSDSRYKESLHAFDQALQAYRAWAYSSMGLMRSLGVGLELPFALHPNY